MSSGDNQTYEWTVGDVRKLDTTLDTIKGDLKSIKDSLKPKTIVVDNSPTGNWDWKKASVVIGTTAATILLVVQEATK